MCCTITIWYYKFGLKQKVQTQPVDNKSYFARGQIHPGLVKSLPRSLNRRRMAASMALGDYRYILDARRPECKKINDEMFWKINV